MAWFLWPYKKPTVSCRVRPPQRQRHENSIGFGQTLVVNTIIPKDFHWDAKLRGVWLSNFALRPRTASPSCLFPILLNRFWRDGQRYLIKQVCKNLVWIEHRHTLVRVVLHRLSARWYRAINPRHLLAGAQSAASMPHACMYVRIFRLIFASLYKDLIWRYVCLKGQWANHLNEWKKDHHYIYMLKRSHGQTPHSNQPTTALNPFEVSSGCCTVLLKSRL